MSFHLSSLGVPGLEPTPFGNAPYEGSTLTLQLRMPRAVSGNTTMTGIMDLHTSPVPAPQARRAAVLAADATPLTITFE